MRLPQNISYVLHFLIIYSYLCPLRPATLFFLVWGICMPKTSILFHIYTIFVMMKKLALIFTLFWYSFTTSAQYFQTPGGPEGGAIAAIESVGAEIWGASSSGIYVSSNEGVSWNLSPVAMNHNIYNIVAWGDTVLVFYSAQTTIINASGNTDVLLIRSIDAGQTWSAPITIMTSMQLIDEMKVNKIKGGLIIELWYNSLITRDKGLTWSPYNPPSAGSQLSEAIDEHTMFYVFADAPNYTPHWYLSTNGALSWQQLSDTLQVMSSYVDSNILILVTYIPATTNYELRRSDDFGQSWALINTTTNQTSLSTNCYQDSIFLGEYNTVNSNFDMYVSHDKGLTWSPTVNNKEWISDPIPISSGAILGIWGYAGAEGIMKLVPNLNTKYPTHSGIRGLTCGIIESHQNVLYTSGGGEILRSFDGGNNWSAINLLIPSGASAYVNAYHFKGDSLFILTGGRIFRSWDNGINWTDFAAPSIGDITGMTSINNTLYVGSAQGSVYKSQDWGQTWASLPVLGLDPFSGGNMIGGYITRHQNELWASTESGTAHKYDPANNTWSANNLNAWTPGAYPGNFLHSLNNYLVFAGRSPEFYVSNDGGQTWTIPAKIGLPVILDTTFNTTDTLTPRFLRLDANGAWIGSVTGYGFFVSNDYGDNWQALQPNTPMAFRNNYFTLMNGIIYASSSYRSIWRSQGTLSTIGGVVYHDINDNGTQDGGEIGLPNRFLLTSPNNFASISNGSGNYSLLTVAVGDSLKPILSNYATHSNPAGVATTGQSFTQNFGLYIPPNLADLQIDVSNPAPFQPGFDRQVTLNYSNEGSLSQSATIKLLLDPDVSLISTTPNYTSLIGDTVIWQTSTLALFQNDIIQVLVNVSSALLPFGDSLRFEAWILGDSSELTPANNYALLHEPVVGSYDPNDKTCSLGEEMDIEDVQDSVEIIYTIRFQNTGNFPTTFVNIEDTLDSHLDVSTLRIIASSHPMIYELTGTHNLKFMFNPLALPPESTNEVESHGFVKYGIKLHSGTSLGTGFTNTAYIYFDFNAPIVTNTTSTWVVLTEEITLELPENHSYQPDLQWKLYPNPTQGDLHIVIEEAEQLKGKLEIMDYTGKILYEQYDTKKETEIELSHWTKGMYICLLKDKNGRVIASVKIVLY